MLTESENNESLAVDLPKYSLSARRLIELNPSKEGYIEKKSNSLLCTTMPCLYPPFQRRYVILLGSYLYRYTAADSDRLKGVPIPLSAIIHVNRVDDFDFELQTIRKVYLFRAHSLDDCSAWIEAIRSRKANSVREEMKHCKLDENIDKINIIAEKMFDKKIMNEMDEAQEVRSPMGAIVPGFA